MSRIVNRQRQLAEQGRLRLGYTVPATKRDGTPTTRPVRSGEEHAIETAVGNRSAVGDGHLLRALPSAQHIGDAVPIQSRTQLGELI